MDTLDRTIINELQGGFPVCDRPYALVAERIGTTEDELMTRIDQLLEEGCLSRFGPMYHAERMGGALTLAAMRIENNDYERVAEQVNQFAEVAHNYERDHEFNMWFVLATETPNQMDAVIRKIQGQTGYQVYNLPKLDEFFVGLRFDV